MPYTPNYSLCPKCGEQKYKTVPAGTSKATGKPYPEFQVCDGCGYKPLKRPNLPPTEKPKQEEIMTGLREIFKLLKEVREDQKQILIGMDVLIKGEEEDTIDPSKIPF